MGDQRSVARSRFKGVAAAALLLFTLAAGLGAAQAEPARATAVHYCVGAFIPGGEGCYGITPLVYERVRSRYHGQQSDGVRTCVSLYRDYLLGGVHCAASWSSPTWNPIGHNFGNGGQGWTFPFLINDTNHGHTFTGWASDNQTDG